MGHRNYINVSKDFKLIMQTPTFIRGLVLVTIYEQDHGSPRGGFSPDLKGGGQFEKWTPKI